MQGSEMVALAGMLVFFLLMGAIAGLVVWRVSRMKFEERRLMIEKGIPPPPLLAATSWPAVKQRENELRFEERRLMIEKGLVPPQEPVPGRWRRDDFLRRGVMFLFLGGGFVITYYMIPDAANRAGWLAYVGPALGMFGLACLTYYALSREDRATSPGSSRPADPR
jgi:hypothetical protein